MGVIARASVVSILGLAASSASAQLVYEPFDYGSGALTGTAANFANTTGSTAFQGYTVPSSGMPWFSTGTTAAAATDDLKVLAGNLQVAGLATATGNMGGSDAFRTVRTPRVQIAPSGLTSNATLYYSLALN